MKEAQEALDTATKAIEGLKHNATPEAHRLALITVFDVCVQLAVLLGVPNAQEPPNTPA
jgi:hypothetical protein